MKSLPNPIRRGYERASPRGEHKLHAVGDARYLLRVSIPALTHPFVYYTPKLYARLSWNEHTILYEWISRYLDTTFRAMVEMRATMALPRITDPAYLALGGSPSEAPRSPTMRYAHAELRIVTNKVTPIVYNRACEHAIESRSATEWGAPASVVSLVSESTPNLI